MNTISLADHLRQDQRINSAEPTNEALVAATLAGAAALAYCVKPIFDTDFVKKIGGGFGALLGGIGSIFGLFGKKKDDEKDKDKDKDKGGKDGGSSSRTASSGDSDDEKDRKKKEEEEKKMLEKLQHLPFEKQQELRAAMIDPSTPEGKAALACIYNEKGEIRKKDDYLNSVKNSGIADNPNLGKLDVKKLKEYTEKQAKMYEGKTDDEIEDIIKDKQKASEEIAKEISANNAAIAAAQKELDNAKDDDAKKKAQEKLNEARKKALSDMKKHVDSTPEEPAKEENPEGDGQSSDGENNQSKTDGENNQSKTDGENNQSKTDGENNKPDGDSNEKPDDAEHKAKLKAKLDAKRKKEAEERDAQEQSEKDKKKEEGAKKLDAKREELYDKLDKETDPEKKKKIEADIEHIEKQQQRQKGNDDRKTEEKEYKIMHDGKEDAIIRRPSKKQEGAVVYCYKSDQKTTISPKEAKRMLKKNKIKECMDLATWLQFDIDQAIYEMHNGEV